MTSLKNISKVLVFTLVASQANAGDVSVKERCKKVTGKLVVKARGIIDKAKKNFRFVERNTNVVKASTDAIPDNTETGKSFGISGDKSWTLKIVDYVSDKLKKAKKTKFGQLIVAHPYITAGIAITPVVVATGFIIRKKIKNRRRRDKHMIERYGSDLEPISLEEERSEKEKEAFKEICEKIEKDFEKIEASK